jgi:hypothetical protein
MEDINKNSFVAKKLNDYEERILLLSNENKKLETEK